MFESTIYNKYCTWKISSAIKINESTSALLYSEHLTYLNIFTTKNRLADENLSGINNTNNCFYLQKPETVCLIAKVKICSLNNKMYECMIKKTFVVSRFPFRFIYRRFIIGIIVRDVRERQKAKGKEVHQFITYRL